MANTAERSPYADRWSLDPTVTFLNHGSFGACPKEVLRVQQEFRDRMERQPLLFLLRQLETLMDQSRSALAEFVGADPQDVVFVPNATEGVNAVLRSLPFQAGDELLTTNHDYNACRNAMAFVAERTDAKIITADVPFPVGSDDQIVDAILARVTPHTRLVMVSHITSPTALIWPVERIVGELSSRGIDTLVDGAHAPAMLDLNLRRLNAAYYTGNCHKWLCAPKGAGFLHVRRDRQRHVRPTVISHAANSLRTNRPRFLMEFDWTGTIDPTPYLCVPAAIRFVSTLMPGGLPALRDHNRTLSLRARDMLRQALGVRPPCPDSMIGSMATVALPDDTPPGDPEILHPTRPMVSPTTRLQDQLWQNHRIEVPIVIWPKPPMRWVRICAQAYNTQADYERLGDALAAMW